jgi:hypothetical protein
MFGTDKSDVTVHENHTGFQADAPRPTAGSLFLSGGPAFSFAPFKPEKVRA